MMKIIFFESKMLKIQKSSSNFFEMTWISELFVKK